MKLKELHEDVTDEFEYPVDHETVLAQIGDTTIDAPDGSDSMTVGNILPSDEDRTYETAEDLFNSIYGNLDDSYIGRKFYDDRGTNIDEGDYERSDDDEDQSF